MPMRKSKNRSGNKIRVADYIVKFLVSHSIRDIFVLTGFGAMYLNDAIASNPKLKYYCVRNEATSPIMAEAYARVKQKPGAVCVTAGPGTANTISGLAEAWVDSAPVIIISGQVLREHTAYNANTPGIRSLGTAELNIIPVVRPLTKYAEMINDPNSIRYHMEKAYYLAISGRPGPVWIDVPMDVQYAKIKPNKLRSFSSPSDKFYPKADLEVKIEKAVNLFAKAKKPIIVGGHGIRQGKAIDEFKRLINILKVPVVLTRLGIDLLPYSNPYNMGMGGMRGRRFSDVVMKEADMILALGTRLAIPFIGENLEKFDKNAPIVAVDIELGELEKPGIHIDVPIHCDVKTFLNELLLKIEGVKLTSRKSWLLKSQKLKKEYPTVTPSMKKNPIDLYYFMSRIDANSTEKNILVTDAGFNYHAAGQTWQFEKNQREIVSATFGAMGLGIPLAIGASIAENGKQVLAVTGDGSLELNIQELKTMSYYNLNIKLFVINNGGYASMRRWQDTFFEGRRIGSDDNTGAQTLNLKKVADAFGLSYEIIERWEDIESKIKLVISNKKPIFVEVICDDKQKLIEPIKSIL